MIHNATSTPLQPPPQEYPPPVASRPCLSGHDLSTACISRFLALRKAWTTARISRSSCWTLKSPVCMHRLHPESPTPMCCRAERFSILKTPMQICSGFGDPTSPCLLGREVTSRKETLMQIGGNPRNPFGIRCVDAVLLGVLEALRGDLLQ